MKVQVLWGLSLLALSGLYGCGDDSNGERGDGALPDASARADGAITPLEGGALDAGRDAAMNRPMEGGLGPAPDSSVNDAAFDAQVDAGGPPACDATSPPVLPSLALAAVVTGRDRLVFAAQPSGSSDWYLVHQKGRIEVFSAGAVRATPFLDLSARFLQSPEPGDERGLLGLAFAPDYATSGKFYIALTPNSGSDAEANRDLVLEYQRSLADPFVADPGSRKEILKLDVSAGNHNGGHIAFGPDGMLYVGTGDGGGGCNSDKPDTPQQPSSLFGKILRLDPKAAPPYAASGNPFSGATGDARVWHYGLRNPFRFGFDSANGDLYIGDVGQVSYEELSVASAAQKGLNFGWGAFEGTVMGTCPGRMLRTGDTHTLPVVHIDRRMNAPADEPYRDYVSIIGGPVYRGTAIPALQGINFFGDYAGRRMGAIRHCGAQTSRPTRIRKARDPNLTEPFFTLPMGVSGFAELTAIVADNAGELYFVANRSSLLKIVPGP